MRTKGMEMASGQHIDHDVAIGGGADSSINGRQMLADASGKRAANS